MELSPAATSHLIPNVTSMSVPQVRSCENLAARSHAARGRRKGRRDPLSRRSTRLRRLHAQTQVLSKYARTQDRAIGL
jgi:hypothetical protein